MRGTGYAISEIVWWMLAAGLIGAVIGWILRRIFGGGGRAKEAEASLEAEKQRYSRISGELGDWKTKAEKLKGDLGSKEDELAAANGRVKDLEGKLAGVRTELDTATSKAGSLETNLADMRGELDSATSKASSLEAKVVTIADKDAEIERLGAEVAGIAGLQSTLGERDSKVSDLEAQLAAKDAEIERLSAEVAGIAGLQSTLGERESRLSDLEAQLAASGSELADVQAQVAAKDVEVGRLGAEVAGIAGLQSTLGERDSKVSDLEAQLAAKGSELAELQTAHAGCGVAADENAGKLAGLEAGIAQRDTTIAELEAKLASAASVAAVAPVAAVSADFEALAESEAEDAVVAGPAPTKFGTAGADHTDDLKLVSGIGPKMEELLNGFGIQSWEQLAEFTESDVDKVDAALEEFPGRIRRDEWVAQAQAIIANGHQPVAKPEKSQDSGDSGWQQGTTALGTPGAGHSDDLKVINGIGPKLEGTLNGFGIQSWEQLAALSSAEIAKVDDALDEFPGRITRDEWVAQAAELVQRFPDRSNRPDRKTYLNESPA